MKKSIKINFVDFWHGFDKSNNYFFNLLKDKFNVDSTTISEIISSLDTEDSFAKSLIAANNVILASFDDFNVTEFSEVELPNNLTTFNIDTTKYLPKFKKLNSRSLN